MLSLPGLLGELLEELFEDELLLDEDGDEDGGMPEGVAGGDVGDELGVAGGWGVVGLLALGQPLSIMHVAASPSSFASERRFICLRLMCNGIGFYNILRNDCFPVSKTRSKFGLA